MNKDGELVMKHEKWTDQHDMSIGQRKKVCVPNRNETRDLLNIRQAIALLSYENSWRARPFN